MFLFYRNRDFSKISVTIMPTVLHFSIRFNPELNYQGKTIASKKILLKCFVPIWLDFYPDYNFILLVMKLSTHLMPVVSFYTPRKYRKTWKTNDFYPLIQTRACAYQGVRNVSFSGFPIFSGRIKRDQSHEMG